VSAEDEEADVSVSAIMGAATPVTFVSASDFSKTGVLGLRRKKSLLIYLLYLVLSCLSPFNWVSNINKYIK